MFMEQYNESIRGAGMDLVFFKDAMINFIQVQNSFSTYLFCDLISTKQSIHFAYHLIKRSPKGLEQLFSNMVNSNFTFFASERS